MTDSIIHDESSATAFPESVLSGAPLRKQPLSFGVYLGVVLLVGLTGGVVGALDRADVGRIGERQLCSGIRVRRRGMVPDDGIIGAVAGFTFMGLVWTAGPLVTGPQMNGDQTTKSGLVRQQRCYRRGP